MCDHTPRESAMVVIQDGIWCDPCLVSLVKALNDGGVPTVASCCGHGRVPSSVILSDDTWLLRVDRPTADLIYTILDAPDAEPS